MAVDMVGRLVKAIIVTVAGLAAAVPPARADGGLVRLSQPAGPFVVTVFTSPTPFRAGPVDISVMVRDRATRETILDAEVAVLLVSLDGASSISADATRQNATNKLLYAALLDLPRSGRWQLSIVVWRDGGAAEVTTELPAASPLPPLLSFWPYLALPAIVVALFALHQWLGARPVATTPPPWGWPGSSI